MRILRLSPHLQTKVLKKKMQEQRDVRLFTYWQIIYSIQSNPGKKAEEYASLLGMPTEKVYRIVQLYNKYGGFDRQSQWGGRRDRRSYLSYKQEQILMEGLEKQAGRGKIITMNDIRSVVEKEVGRSVSDDYLWDLFKRHGWKKKAPRPQHPQKDEAAQQAFKKNFPSFWSPAGSKN